MKLASALTFSHELLTKAVRKGDTVIDGTAGNGHDTVFLAKLVGETGKVLAFDVQQLALKTTQTALTDEQLMDRVQLIHDSHANINRHLQPDRMINGAIFNLGYLPGADKSVTTQPDSTLTALKNCLHHLAVGGVLIVVLYYGHPAGKLEKQAVLKYASSLEQHQFQVLTYQFINQVHEPPILLAIQKR